MDSFMSGMETMDAPQPVEIAEADMPTPRDASPSFGGDDSDGTPTAGIRRGGRKKKKKPATAPSPPAPDAAPAAGGFGFVQSGGAEVAEAAAGGFGFVQGSGAGDDAVAGASMYAQAAADRRQLRMTQEEAHMKAQMDAQIAAKAEELQADTDALLQEMEAQAAAAVEQKLAEAADKQKLGSTASMQMVIYDSHEFSPEVDHPEGIFSYASRSDGGKGIAHMWAVGNALRVHGIRTYCGLMVRTDNWQEKWFGKLNKAKFAIVMLSNTY
jgi:hypothetical protein